MRVEQLLGIFHVKDENLSKDELRMQSIFSDKKLPKKGITLAKNMDAYQAVVELIKSSKAPVGSSPQIISLMMRDSRVIPKTDPRLSWDDVKNSNYIRLTDVASEVYEPIHEEVWKWVDERTQKNTKLLEEFKDKVFYKHTTEGIKPKLTSTRSVIAEFPEIIDLIHALPEFNHLDAISYNVKVNDQMVEFITIFRDDSLFLDDFSKSQKHVKASMSNYKGYLMLPNAVIQSKKLITLAQAKEFEKNEVENSKVKVA